MTSPEQYARRWVAEHAPKAPQRDAEGVVVAATDWLGNTFTLGEPVMYCIGAGRGQMMAVGEVIKIVSEAKQRSYMRPAEEGETPATTNSDGGWVWDDLDYDDVRVLVRTLRTSGRYDNDPRSKPAWVNPMNITALPAVVNT